jgi:hypothetical protein
MCRSEEAGERSDPAPERRHVPKGKAHSAAAALGSYAQLKSRF